jgi:Na+-transporting NADH:ubiquinone oxidoreductase subunit NqrB
MVPEIPKCPLDIFNPAQIGRGFLFKFTLPVDILDGKRTLSDSRLW